MIMDSVGAIAVESDSFNSTHVNCIKNHSIAHTKPLLTVTINHQSLYELDTSPTVMPCHTDPVMSCDTNTWSPSPELTERHQRWSVYFIKAMASYYSTAEFQTDRDLVRFFHEAWDHPSREIMCKIVDSNAFDNLPKRLTSKRIRKLFP